MTKPILFSGEMVRAILAGQKTQSRRVVTLRNDKIIDLFDDDYLKTKGFCGFDTANFHNKPVRCPYGKPGERLWVRETFAPNPYWDASDNPLGLPRFFYRADAGDYEDDGTWKPSIHMPRIASRITLEITDIRVEKLQEISEADAKAEGIFPGIRVHKAAGSSEYPTMISTAVIGFARLWDKINAKRGCSWESNPLVWIIEFKQVANN